MLEREKNVQYSLHPLRHRTHIPSLLNAASLGPIASAAEYDNLETRHTDSSRSRRVSTHSAGPTGSSTHHTAPAVPQNSPEREMGSGNLSLNLAMPPLSSLLAGTNLLLQSLTMLPRMKTSGCGRETLEGCGESRTAAPKRNSVCRKWRLEPSSQHRPKAKQGSASKTRKVPFLTFLSQREINMLQCSGHIYRSPMRPKDLGGRLGPVSSYGYCGGQLGHLLDEIDSRIKARSQRAHVKIPEHRFKSYKPFLKSTYLSPPTPIARRVDDAAVTS